MFYVYVLEDSVLGWYIGYTADLRRRLHEHRTKKNPTTSRGEYRLIYYEAYGEKMDAIGREKFLKSGAGRRYLKNQLRFHLEMRR